MSLLDRLRQLIGKDTNADRTPVDPLGNAMLAPKNAVFPPNPSEERWVAQIEKATGSFLPDDYLGRSAAVGQLSMKAQDDGDYDAAWRYIHEQKSLYLRHSAKCGFSIEQTLGLDGALSRPLANILRKEGKHKDALVHMVYCLATEYRPVKSEPEKLRAYFNRCKFKRTTLEDAEVYFEKAKRNPDFVSIRNTIAEWN